MRAALLLGMLILGTGISQAKKTDSIPKDKKKITRSVINTRAPFVHFCLNTLGIGCIIKGSGMHVPIVRSCIEIKRVNFCYLIAGIMLLTTSQVLHYIEPKEEFQNE